MGKPSPSAARALPLVEIDPEALRAGERLFERPWEFLKSVPSLEFLPPADRPEFAFAGRSNVGKSSLFNALVRQQGLARTSNTPGRTQELNFFVTAGIPLYLVDMPGYGFAKAPKEKVEIWTELVRNYLRGRQTLKRVFLLIDTRHGIKAVDREIIKLLNEAAVSFQVVLTKADKVNESTLKAVIASTATAIAVEPAAFPDIIVTSSEKNIGIDHLRSTIATMIDMPAS